MYSQLDMTVHFQKEGTVVFEDWAAKPQLRGLAIGLIPVVRVWFGLVYLGSVVMPDVITRETRLALDKILKI